LSLSSVFVWLTVRDTETRDSEPGEPNNGAGRASRNIKSEVPAETAIEAVKLEKILQAGQGGGRVRMPETRQLALQPVVRNNVVQHLKGGGSKNSCGTRVVLEQSAKSMATANRSV